MIDITLIKNDVALTILFGATIAYLLRGNSTELLLQIIILGGLAWVSYGYLMSKSTKAKDTVKDTFGHLDKIGKDRKETNFEIFNIGTFPKKGFKYLQKNAILIEIVLDVALLKMFDKAKYGDLLVLMNQYQKTYIYILTERYYFQSYFPTFLDLGDKILEIMYEMYFALPSNTLKHTYGVVPFELIEKNIERFTVLRRKMITILESFAKKQLGVEYIQESLPKPNDNAFNEIKLRQLP